MLIDNGSKRTVPPSTEVRGLQDSDLDSFLSFARAYYGEHSHQASRQRLDWLHRCNPLSRGLSKDAAIAVDGRVVGCHFKTRLPWRIGSERVVIPSLHDLALLPEYRDGRSMVGGPLTLFGCAREEYAALLGLSPAADAIYHRLKCARVPMIRMRHFLSLRRVLTAVVRDKLNVDNEPPTPTGFQMSWQIADFTAEVWSDPDQAVLERALEIPYNGDCHLDWDIPSFTWRFFHPLGPRNVLVLLSCNGRLTARAVFSYGCRRGAVMARIVDAATRNPDCLETLFRSVERAMRRLRVGVATVATTSIPARQCLAGMGWKVQKGVESRFFARSGRSLAMPDIWGGAYDYGFDAQDSAPPRR